MTRTAAPSAEAARPDATDRAWESRPGAALALESLFLIGPLVGSGAVVWALSPVVRSHAWPVRFGLLLAVGLVVGLLVQRLARRLMPLRALLRLTMVFPDTAPSRYQVARRAGHPGALVDRLRSPDVGEAEAAELVLALVAALRKHDRHTRGHCERVRAYTDLLTEALGLPEQARDRLRWAALLHDIGKIEVPTSLLNKPGAPTAAEWVALREHPETGYELTRALHPWLGEWGGAIVEHHERVDGTGYPLGVRGDQISIAGRLVAVVDCFETMTAVRAYKKAMTHRAARAELARCAGTHFDPVVVRAFLAISVPRLVWAMGPLSALLQLPFIAGMQAVGGRAVDLASSSASSAGSTAVAGGLAAGILLPVAPLAVLGPGPDDAVAGGATVVAQAAEPAQETLFATLAAPARDGTVRVGTQVQGTRVRSTQAGRPGRGVGRTDDRPRGAAVAAGRDQDGRAEAEARRAAKQADKQHQAQAKEQDKAQKEQDKAQEQARKDEERRADEQVRAEQQQSKAADEAARDAAQDAERRRKTEQKAEQERASVERAHAERVDKARRTQQEQQVKATDTQRKAQKKADKKQQKADKKQPKAAKR